MINGAGDGNFFPSPAPLAPHALPSPAPLASAPLTVFFMVSALFGAVEMTEYGFLSDAKKS